MTHNQIKIIIPFYNVESWIKTSIQAIKSQTYSNFKCILLDDVSSDKSAQIVEELIVDDPRFLLIKNSEKKYALKNIYDGIEYLKPSEEDIIVIIDGDDWLANKRSLEIVDKYYLEDPNTLMTYGTYIEYPTGRIPNNVKEYSRNVLMQGRVRQDIWRASHLRTFKYKLWKSINPEDLKDQNGNFYVMTGDLATMFPMLEMARERAKYIKEIIYCYNFSNPINDEKINHSLQLTLENEIRNKKVYNRKEFT